MVKNYTLSAGFTFIELIIVMSITAMLSTIGIASFLSYSRSENLQQSAYTVSTYLQTARSDTLSQVKPVGICSGALQSYQVLICCKGGGTNCPSCQSSGNVEIDVSCGSNPPAVVMSSVFSPDVIVDNANTTQRSFVFTPLTTGIVNITGSVNVVLKNTIINTTKTVTVTSAGVIQ